MIEHFGNCHGELTFLMSIVTSIPFVRFLFFRRKKSCPCPADHTEGEKHA